MFAFIFLGPQNFCGLEEALWVLSSHRRLVQLCFLPALFGWSHHLRLLLRDLGLPAPNRDDRVPLGSNEPNHCRAHEPLLVSREVWTLPQAEKSYHPVYSLTLRSCLKRNLLRHPFKPQIIQLENIIVSEMLMLKLEPYYWKKSLFLQTLNIFPIYYFLLPWIVQFQSWAFKLNRQNWFMSCLLYKNIMYEYIFAFHWAKHSGVIWNL